ncbi:hypothetical protein AVEN_33404-1 [Araneus ventricosus]|uniref:Uncharacterized protein n=1 Tax=Araneus ventricosus TaxID=182803 RepID=A0A4Y2P387_ARAVE|nr:hypothetical protein AVEN_33404-1 [Araneus ventricosus]
MVRIGPTTKQARKKGQMSVLALPRSLKLGIIQAVPVAFSLDDDKKVEDVLRKEKDEGDNPTSLFRCLVIRSYLACDWMYSYFKNKITTMYYHLYDFRYHLFNWGRCWMDNCVWHLRGMAKCMMLKKVGFHLKGQRGLYMVTEQRFQRFKIERELLRSSLNKN